jgi:hypothetical protein
MSANYYLDELERLGETKLAQDVRHSLPSATKLKLEQALSENERVLQKAILEQDFSRRRRSENIERCIRGVLFEMTRTS